MANLCANLILDSFPCRIIYSLFGLLFQGEWGIESELGHTRSIMMAKKMSSVSLRQSVNWPNIKLFLMSNEYRGVFNCHSQSRIRISMSLSDRKHAGAGLFNWIERTNRHFRCRYSLLFFFFIAYSITNDKVCAARGDWRRIEYITNDTALNLL